MGRMTREERDTMRKWNSEQAGSYRRATQWKNNFRLSTALAKARVMICLRDNCK